MRCEGIFMLLNQFINIVLLLVNIEFGNIYCMILEIWNPISGMIFYFKRVRETVVLGSNIIYIVVTATIFLCYHHQKLFS